MLFVVPDDSPSNEGADSANPESAPSGSVFSGDNLKVELDLDGAPFLEEEPAPAPPPAHEEDTPEEVPEQPSQEQKPAGLREKILARLRPVLERMAVNKKKLAIAGAAALVLLVAAVLVNIFLFSGTEESTTSVEAANTATPAQPEVTRIVVPSSPPANATAAVPAPHPYLFELDPFWVEKRGTEGELRFLTCRIVLATDKEILNAEFSARLLTLRDAIYYYLRNRPVTLLDSEVKSNTLRADLISVINEHLSSGKVADLYIKDYLVTTP